MSGKILFIIVDQLRADCLNGALAHAVDMPNLRALMKEGVTFNRHFTNTVPCGPSRVSLLTSLYAMNHRAVQNGTPLAANHPTVATQMREAGYDPLLFGYTDTSPDPAGLHPNDPILRTEEGLARGFSEIVRMRFQDNSSWIGYLKEKGYKIPGNFWDLYKPVAPDPSQPPLICDPALYSDNDSDTAFLTNQTLRELSVRTHLDWFSTLTYIRPHPPLVAPSPYNTMYDPKSSPAPVALMPLDELKSSHPFFNAYFRWPSITNLHIGFDGQIDKMTSEAVAELRAVYFGLITELDHHIGRVISFLKDTGQYDDTLIVFTADHGEMLGDNHMWGKNTPHNASFHVPLIIRDPRNPEAFGQEINAFTEAVDIAPTLLDWVGEKSPPGFNGKSLLPWLAGKTPKEWRTHMFAEMDMGDKSYGLRYQKEFGTMPPQSNLTIIQDTHYKLVYFNGGVEPLLYDMKIDPAEAGNLANDPRHAQTLLAMTRKMLDHRMTHAHHALSRMLLTPTGLEEH